MVRTVCSIDEKGQIWGCTCRGVEGDLKPVPRNAKNLLALETGPCRSLRKHSESLVINGRDKVEAHLDSIMTSYQQQLIHTRYCYKQ